MKSGPTSAAAVARTSTARAPGLSQFNASKSWTSVWVKIVQAGTAAGSAGPGGSRVNERISCTEPTRPSDTASWAATKSAAKRRLKPTWKATPARAVAAVAVSISARVIPAGFSQKTCFRRLGGCDDERGVGDGGGGHHHRVDVLGAEDRLDGGLRPGAEWLRDGDRRAGTRVADGYQLRLRDAARDDRCVRSADPARPDEPDPTCVAICVPYRRS